MRLRIAVVAAAALAASVVSAPAQTSDFYKGRQISIVVNYTTGGPTDTEARLLSRHLARHIPGEPNIVVRNMAGAGGMIAVNWLGQVAPPDGLTLGYFTALGGASAEGTDSLKIDPTSIPFIAGVKSLQVYYARSDLGGGLKTAEDLMTKNGFWVGGLTPDSPKDLQLRAAMDLLGRSYRYITGYAGAAEVRLALEQNEVQATAESLPTYRVSIEPALIKTGKAIPLWYDTSAENVEAGDPDAVGIDALPFPRYYRKVKGAPPDNDLWRMNALLTELSTTLLRTIHVPPNTSPALIAILRKAVDETQNDPAYRADALTTIKYAPRFSTGADADRIYRQSVQVDAHMRSFIQSYIAKGVAMVGK